MFAGTGSQDKDKHVSLLADISRVRAGDSVVFYIEARKNTRGGFYGVFRVRNQDPCVHQCAGADAVEPNLGKKLIYRVLLEPLEVYSQGVSEFDALDRLPVYATELQWSLIYRKLKGRRGCTPLLPWEADRLVCLIRNANRGQIIAGSGYAGGLKWDADRRLIALTENRPEYPLPTRFAFDTVKEILELRQKRRAYEVHLQLYLTQRAGVDESLEPIVGRNLKWFGNEIACGVSMQKIDLLAICDTSRGPQYRLVELKDQPVQPGIVEQLEYYVTWASQDSGRHIPEAQKWNLQPVIVAPAHRHSRRSNWNAVIDAFHRFNDADISLPIRYVEFDVVNADSLVFAEVEY